MTSTDDDFLMTVVSLNDVIKNCTNMYVYVLWLTFMIDITTLWPIPYDDTLDPTTRDTQQANNFFSLYSCTRTYLRRFDVVK